MRLPNGYGSVYKLSGKRRKPYIAMTSHGIDNNGKVIRKPLGYYKTKSEALTALGEYNRDPAILDLSKIKFGEALKEYVEYRDSCKPLTYAYKSALNKVKPFHDELLTNIKTKDIQDIMNTLTPSMSSFLKSALSGFYKYCVTHDYIKVNYAESLIAKPIPKSTLHKPFTPEEIHELWLNKDAYIAKVALVMIFTGVRTAELFVLENKNVFSDHIITGVKTEAGKNRIIPLHKAIVPFIKELQSDGDMFMDGSITRFRRRWSRCKIPAIENHIPHDTRHTCETMMWNAGISKRTMQLIVGHAGRDVDESVYIHNTFEQLYEAINKLPTYESLC